MDLIEFLKTMHNKYIFLSASLLFLFLTSGIFAQQRTYSPYSRYGIGEIQESGFGRNFGMGNTGIALKSPYHLNDMNPASYASMDSISFYFEGGLTGFSQTLKTPTDENQFSDINFSYFALGFPLARWGFFSMGLKPTSVVGYEFFNDNSSDKPINDPDYYKYNGAGSGNIARVYAGLAVRPVEHLSIGVHFAYHFGNLKHNSLVQYPNDRFAHSVGTSEKIRVNDIHFDFGAQYELRLDAERSFIFGATFAPKQQMKGEIVKLAGQGTAIQEEDRMVVIADTLAYSKSDDIYEIPLSYGIGVAYNIDHKLLVTADYSTSLYSNADIPGENSNVTTTDRQKYAFGMEYIPNDRSADFYLSRIRYRLGTYYIQDYLVVGGNQMEDFGISFGLGLPLKRSKTSLNVGFQWGKRGTSDNSLTKENYAKVTLNLTLHEFWFMQRKFE